MVRIGAALPRLDAALTSYSLVATWWQTRKHTANWWLWIAVDLVYIGEYLYKGLRPTAALYALLVALAVLGLRNWRRGSSYPILVAEENRKDGTRDLVG
jgi:nicotinamide mononucleotide transporter